ncbi:unnamed protein product [Orchesella dallaii]|uniref:Gustatory receptor n=1 Tax=Orchesella dallaii TaxID=48710 RepID=A0ABP1RP78_9HEXA
MHTQESCYTNKILVSTLNPKGNPIRSQRNSSSTQPKTHKIPGTIKLLQWYFLTGYYTLLFPFKFTKTIVDGQQYWKRTGWKLQKALSLLVWWPLAWVFYLTELIVRSTSFINSDAYNAKQYFKLGCCILHTVFQFMFFWIVVGNSKKLEKFFNDVYNCSLLYTNDALPVSSTNTSVLPKWKSRGLLIYMVFMHAIGLTLVLVNNLFFGAYLGKFVAPSEQLLNAIKIGRQRFFIDEISSENLTSTLGLNSSGIYTTENVIIGVIELVIEFVRLWNNFFTGAFIYGALPLIFWTSAKGFQAFLLGVSSTYPMILNKALHSLQAELVVEKYEELRSLLRSINSTWGSIVLVWVIEMTLTVVVRMNNAIESKNLIVVYFSSNILFLVVSLVLMAEGHRSNFSFKQWLSKRYTREKIFAQNRKELEWLEKDLEVSSVSIGSPGVYEISYGFLGQLLVFTVTVFLISFDDSKNQVVNCRCDCKNI